MMDMNAMWEDMSSSEKDMFQRGCRKLLKQTFIVRDKDEENKKLYYFVSKKTEALSTYFSYIGFDIVIDRDNGVVMLRNCADFGQNGKLQANRIQFRKDESIVLCCLWTLYADRLRTGSLAQTIVISMTDLSFALEKYGVRDALDNKTIMGDILKQFKKYNLIDLDGKVGDTECKIRLYASLQFALDTEAFKRFVEATDKRMRDKEGGLAEDEDDDVE